MTFFNSSFKIELDFRAYYPHIFGSASESKKYMEKALENIMKSKMPEDKKNVEIYHLEALNICNLSDWNNCFQIMSLE